MTQQPAPQSNNRLLFICIGVTFVVVLAGIVIGGLRHFVPGLFNDEAQAAVPSAFDAHLAKMRAKHGTQVPGGSGPASATPSTAPVPMMTSRPSVDTPVTGTVPAPPAPVPSTPVLDVAAAIALLDAPEADKRAEALAALRAAGPAGVTALLARLRMEQSKNAEASARVKELERALQSALAQTSVERERREDAETRSDDKRAADLYQQATTAVEADNFAKARVLAEAVIRLSPDHVGARALRARCALEAGDGRAAFNDYMVAVRLDPRFAPHHRGMGRALLAMQRPSEAVQAFERALSIDPGDLESIQLREAARKQSKLPEGK